MSSPELAHAPSPALQPTEYSRPEAAAAPTFDALYEAWFDEVTRWARALGGTEADLDDLVQDVFLIVYRRLPDFDGKNVAGWLYQIARHKVRDQRRLAWFRHLRFGRSGAVELEVSRALGPAESLEYKQRTRLLNDVLQALNDDQRAAFVLFELEGLSGEQIASLTGVPLNTVWARIHKARKKLRQNLDRLERARGLT
jgi:RNA polymerase sigma-70 factor, ECF subfamily